MVQCLSRVCEAMHEKSAKSKLNIPFQFIKYLLNAIHAIHARGLGFMNDRKMTISSF